MVERTDSIKRHGREVEVARSGQPVPEDPALYDYVMLDFVEDFVIPGDQHVSEPDLSG